MSIENNHQLRNAIADDSESLAGLARRSFEGYPFDYVFSPKGVKEALERGEKRYLVAGPDGKVIGSAVLGLNETKMAEIMRVMVDPSLRQNGLATFLTKELALEAIKFGKYSWADVRGDQIGMQRAALSSGLKAVSIEPGKHVVYEHVDLGGKPLGAARESMVHMTTLPIDELLLKEVVSSLDHRIRNKLTENLRSALYPQQKKLKVVKETLISATETKSTIIRKMESNINEFDNMLALGQDVLSVKVKGVSAILVLPDASAFILGGTNVGNVLRVFQKIGIQVATLYNEISPGGQHLLSYGMTPTSIRPWIDETSNGVVWQIGWRKTFNNFEDTLHNIDLDPIVKRQAQKIADIVEGIKR